MQGMTASSNTQKNNVFMTKETGCPVACDYYSLTAGPKGIIH